MGLKLQGDGNRHTYARFRDFDLIMTAIISRALFLALDSGAYCISLADYLVSFAAVLWLVVCR